VADQPPPAAEPGATPPARVREPSLLDALAPIVVLIGLITLTIALFGVAATDGPLQVALLLSAAFASLVAFKNGYTVAEVAEAIVSGVSSALGAIFILLAVGALIGTWNMAGTIPTVVTYGISIMTPEWFYLATAVICALVGMVTAVHGPWRDARGGLRRQGAGARSARGDRRRGGDLRGVLR
jgi:Na+:H+ antiporter, NhaC family